MKKAAFAYLYSPSLIAHGPTWRWAIKLEVLHTIMVLAIFAMGLGFSAALGVNVYKFKFQFSALVVGLSLVGAMVSVWSLSSPLVKVVERSLEREPTSAVRS